MFSGVLEACTCVVRPVQGNGAHGLTGRDYVILQMLLGIRGAAFLDGQENG